MSDSHFDISLDISRYAGYEVHSSPTFSKKRGEKTAITAVIWDYIPAVTGTRHRTGRPPATSQPKLRVWWLQPSTGPGGNTQHQYACIFHKIMMSEASHEHQGYVEWFWIETSIIFIPAPLPDLTEKLRHGHMWMQNVWDDIRPCLHIFIVMAARSARPILSSCRLFNWDFYPFLLQHSGLQLGYYKTNLAVWRDIEVLIQDYLKVHLSSPCF